MFGHHLNKRRTVKSAPCGEDEGGGEDNGPTWKLRKWTKGIGYRTVVGGRKSSSQQQHSGNGGMEVCNTLDGGDCSKKDVTATSFTAKKEDVHVCTFLRTCTVKI